MKQNEKNNAIFEYSQRVIKNSWTWERLTQEEKNCFNSINFDEVKGTEKQRHNAVMLAYTAFLYGVGYSGCGWRD